MTGPIIEHMNKKDVIEHFGSVRATAEAFGLTTQAVYKWPQRVPELIAIRADRLSNHALEYDEEEYRE